MSPVSLQLVGFGMSKSFVVIRFEVDFKHMDEFRFPRVS